MAVGWAGVHIRSKVWGLVCVAGNSRQYTENHYGDRNQGALGSESGSERKA